MTHSLTPTDTEPELSAGQYALAAWLATPSREREPETQAALACSLHVSEATLSRWRRLPHVRDEVRRLIAASMGERLPDVLSSLEEQAVAGSFQHQKLYLELVGLTRPEQQSPPPTSLKVLVGIDLSRV